MIVRSIDLKSEVFNTHLGEVHVDQFGTVVNGTWFEGGVQALLDAKIPTLVDAELFPPKGGYPKGYKLVELDRPEIVLPEIKEKKPSNVIIARPIAGVTVQVDEGDYWRVIRELSMDAENLNLQGYVDQDILNANLRVLGYPILTGTQRRDITDKYRKIEAEVAGEPGLPVEE